MSHRLRRVGFALFVLLQLFLVGTVTWTGSGLLLAFGEIGLVSVTVAVVVVARYAGLRAAYIDRQQEQLREAERRSVLDDVHDLIGHELGLIAMQAGLLRLRTTGTEAELAGQLHDRAQTAVTTLHETVRMIGAHQPDHPAGADITTVLNQARAAGIDLHVTGTLGAVDAPTGIVAVSVVREGLTNAAKHAPGRPVRIRLHHDAASVDITVATEGASSNSTSSAARGGRGLAAMERRLNAVGGSLDTRYDGANYLLEAQIPCPIADQAVPARRPAAPTPMRILAREALLPLGVVVVLVVGFYTWATHNATIEPSSQRRLVVGMTTARARDFLPSRQAPMRLVNPPPSQPGWACRSYTNGNFPLGIATLEICTAHGTVVQVTDLARRSPW